MKEYVLGLLFAINVGYIFYHHGTQLEAEYLIKLEKNAQMMAKENQRNVFNVQRQCQQYVNDLLKKRRPRGI